MDKQKPSLCSTHFFCFREHFANTIDKTAAVANDKSHVWMYTYLRERLSIIPLKVSELWKLFIFKTAHHIGWITPVENQACSHSKCERKDGEQLKCSIDLLKILLPGGVDVVLGQDGLHWQGCGLLDTQSQWWSETGDLGSEMTVTNKVCRHTAPIQSTITFPQTSFNQRQRQGVPTSLCLLIEPTVRVPEKCRWHEGVTDICVGQGCQEESQGWKGTADQKRTVYFCLHTHTEGKNEEDKMCRKPHNPPKKKWWA